MNVHVYRIRGRYVRCRTIFTVFVRIGMYCRVWWRQIVLRYLHALNKTSICSFHIHYSIQIAYNSTRLHFACNSQKYSDSQANGDRPSKYEIWHEAAIRLGLVILRSTRAAALWLSDRINQNNDEFSSCLEFQNRKGVLAINSTNTKRSTHLLVYKAHNTQVG